MEPDIEREKMPGIHESLADLPDEDLLCQWKSGYEDAASVLFDRYALRLVALVASRLSRRYNGSIDPAEVVQSAMGSFFDAARHSRIQVNGSVSLWRLLATFARRKMARSIEKQSAAKRGGDHERVSLNEAELQTAGRMDDFDDEASEFLTAIKGGLADDLGDVLERLLAGQTKKEIADALFVDERTVRRRVARIRDAFESAQEMSAVSNSDSETISINPARKNITLQHVSYREFVLGRMIGSGGFGKVYRAVMQSNGRTVAVKFLRKTFWKVEDARQTFLREIDAASQINHPGVIRYLGYGESPHGGPYVISEWIDGKSMGHTGVLDEDRFIGWLMQICEGIQSVHEAGLIHGDITPSNILIRADDQITIADFGFSRAAVSEQAVVQSQSSSHPVGGTLGFAAPEQLSPAFGQISVKTDVYAIGALVFWFILSRPPNAGTSIENMLAQTLSVRELDLSKVDEAKLAAAAPRLQNILKVTLRKSPSNRTSKVSELIEILK